MNTKPSYLSILWVSRALVAANARGQGSGNIQTLQHIHTGEADYTVLSGYAEGFALRENIKALYGSEACWRLSGATESASGFGFGPQRAVTMAQGFADIPGDPDQRQWQYLDLALRGGMTAPSGSGEGGSEETEGEPEDESSAKGKKKGGKGKKEQKGETGKKATQFRGTMALSPGLSTTPYQDEDLAFTKGLKDDGTLNPFNAQRHYTRYKFLVSFDLATLGAHRPDAVEAGLRTLFAGLRIGGSHNSNLSEVQPDVLVWRFHHAAGSGLFLSQGKTNHWAPDQPVDLTPLYEQARDLGIEAEIQVGGTSVSDITIAEAINRIVAQTNMIFAQK